MVQHGQHSKTEYLLDKKEPGLLCWGTMRLTRRDRVSQRGEALKRQEKKRNLPRIRKQ